MTVQSPANEQVIEIAIRQPSSTGTSYQSYAAPAGYFGNTETYSGLSMSEAIKTVFSKYARFEGRATRSEYWFFALFNFLIFGGLVLLGSLLSSASGGSDMATLAGFLIFVWAIAVLLPSIAVTVRRLHDAGYSGWIYLLGLVPYVGGLVLFIFALLSSQPVDNKWGKAPKPASTAGFQN